MKAILVHGFGGPEVFRLEEVPKPQPGPGQVLVRMQAIGVNPVETYIRARTRNPARRCWCTARAVVSGPRPCNWRVLAVCACLAPLAVTKDASSRANKARTKSSIIARLTSLNKSWRRPAGAALT